MAATAEHLAPTSIVAIPVDQLTLGLDFRLDDDADDLTDLAASIRDLGVLQPLVVRQTADGYEVLAGRRRLAAARTAGIERVPCVLRQLDDDAAADIALAENIHRRQLSSVEEALAYARLRDRGLTQAQIGQRVGRSQKHVSTLLQILELPEWLRQKIHRREISYVTAIDKWGRKKFRETGANRPGGASSTPDPRSMDGATAELVTHWRRRHDRLLAGLHRIKRARADGVTTAAGVITLIERLIDNDLKPLPDERPGT